MNCRVEFSAEARSDIERLYRSLASESIPAAEQALATLGKAWEMLALFPYASRKASTAHPFLRELVIPLGRSGYVALFEIVDPTLVLVLAIRHQREEDYY